MTWPHNAVPDGRYTDLIAVATRAGRAIDHDVLTQLLMQSVAEDHWRTTGPGPLVEFTDGPAAFLFAQAGTSHADRTVLAVGHPEPPHEIRDVAYQRGYPLPDTFAGRPVDRGHLIPYTGGGQYGPNLFVQDRALNRGWSRDGRGYRALERAAVAGAPATLMFARPRYVDDTDVPGFIDLGVATATEVAVHTFRNRFDMDGVAGSPRQLEIVLAGATNAQIGALGEETASVLLTENFDATIVAMGDAGLPRDGTRQDLDLLAFVGTELIAYEVKTSYASTKAGHLTRAGNLRRPPLQRCRIPGSGQATSLTSPTVSEPISTSGMAMTASSYRSLPLTSWRCWRSGSTSATRARRCDRPGHRSTAPTPLNKPSTKSSITAVSCEHPRTPQHKPAS